MFGPPLHPKYCVRFPLSGVYASIPRGVVASHSDTAQLYVLFGLDAESLKVSQITGTSAVEVGNLAPEGDEI